MPKQASKFSDDTLIGLYERGLTDKEIAEELGVSQSAVNYRREKLCLPSNYKRSRLSDSSIARMNDEGFTDKEIAEELGVSQSSVNYRRQRLGLSSNYVKNKFSEERLIALYNEGFSDREIAEVLDVTPAAINYRRERLRLKSNSKAIDMDEFSSLYIAGYPIENIAHNMGISVAKAYDAKEELLWKKRPSHAYSDQEGM